ncbi:GTP pyrophosphokinase [Micrococcus lylae]|uniref:GTP pyrophosphokinase n=1 Tax=Micrococcus lylae TaxID=1273 RepID=A0A1R4JL64_9MICC|nr:MULTISPECIES: GTP pyrophosphokinase family protein [Micrococcus]PNL16922.1 GTP pyrophosphokinase [Micrococcus sp. FDAARGOS_333]SJN32790.1 GTP pyrophosphokinase [Micrococcus lylae]
MPSPVPQPDEPPAGDAAAPGSTLVPLSGTPVSDLTRLPPAVAQALDTMRSEFERFDLEYRSALNQVESRLEVLQDEFTHLHDYNPIEHIATRVKSAQSILRKATARGLTFDLDELRTEITDIAGARVVVSFSADVYRVFELFTAQPDIELLQVKDYIAEPKANGYRSLHCIVHVPVHFSTGVKLVVVEVQFRTSAMDFWASLEHKINYKFDGDIPPHIVTELTAAADVANELDARMEHLHRQVRMHEADAEDEGLFPADMLFTPSEEE